MALAPGMAASMVGRRGGLAVTGYRGRLRSERGLRTGRTVVAQWGEYSAPRPGARARRVGRYLTDPIFPSLLTTQDGRARRSVRVQTETRY